MKDKIVEYLERQIEKCDDLTCMEREKWAFQQCLKEARKLPPQQPSDSAGEEVSDDHEPEYNQVTDILHGLCEVVAKLPETTPENYDDVTKQYQTLLHNAVMKLIEITPKLAPQQPSEGEIPKCPHENTFVCKKYCNTDSCGFHPNYK